MRPAIQLHTVRELEMPLPDVLRWVADCGFEGVEFAGRIRHANPDAVAETLDETGLVPVGAHVPLAHLERDRGPLLDLYKTVNCRYLTIPHLPPKHFRTRNRVHELGDRLEEVSHRLETQGFRLLYHNIRYDLIPPLGRPGLGTLIDSGRVPGVVEGSVFERLRQRKHTRVIGKTGLGRLSSYTRDINLGFEIDTGEVYAAGYTPGTIFDAFGDRLPLVHVCDVTDATDGYRSTAPGTGVTDYDAVFAGAVRNNVEWLVFEDDHPKDPATILQQGADVVVDGMAEFLHAQ